jgi:DNA-binding PucR family transcriptional regulator
MAHSPDHAAATADHLALLRSLSDVASHINASSEIDTTLRHLLEAVCRNQPWAAGGIMSVDVEEGYAQVIARHDPTSLGANMNDRWLLAESPSRVALGHGEPIIIPDAQSSKEYPGYRREAREHGYRTVVVLPMQYRNQQGHRTVLSVRSREIVDVGASDIALLQFVVHLGEIAMNKARSLAEEQAFGQRLKGALAAHGDLLDQVLADGSVEATAERVMDLITNPLLVVDMTSRRIHARLSPVAIQVGDDAWCAEMDGEAGRQFFDLARRNLRGGRLDTRDIDVTVAGKTMRLPAIVCPLMVDGERVGLMVVFSGPGGFHQLDHLLLECARFGLSAQMMRSYVAHAATARGIEDLFIDLLDGKFASSADIVTRARRFGIDLDRPARLTVFSLSTDGAMHSATDVLRAIEERAVRSETRIAVLRRNGSIIVRLPNEIGRDAKGDDLVRRLAADIQAEFGEMPIVVESKACRQPSDYAAAWQECCRIGDLARRFDRAGIVSAEDFGALAVLMSAVDATEMHAFVQRLVGMIAEHDRKNGTAYLETLSSYLDFGGRSQPCADSLGLHVTTLRYRLTRLRELYSVATETPEQRFALQLALRVHRLIAPRASAATSRPGAKAV